MLLETPSSENMNQADSVNPLHGFSAKISDERAIASDKREIQ
jgi:hypothetical protein